VLEPTDLVWEAGANVRFAANPTIRWRGDEGLKWVKKQTSHFEKPKLFYLSTGEPRLQCGGR
jgi:hypothetical protein